MPTMKGEQLYSAPGPNNSTVLMDIISKLKHDLQKSRAENGKLVDQLNCLISLVKRSWSGDDGAMMHLANIIGVVPPSLEGSNMPRNTPVPEKTKAVQNWERMAIRLLEKDYKAIQQQIREQQRLYIQNRQQYMDEVLQDHQNEMSRFSLHRQKNNVEEVDKKFFRCYSAKAGRGGRKPPAGYRPKSAFVSRPKTASEMAEAADMTVEDLLGTGSRIQHSHNNNNQTTTSLYKLSSAEQDHYHGNRTYDDANRYKHSNLFDPDVIFSPEMMAKNSELKSRPSSAVSIRERPKSGTRSSVFMTEPRPERSLKYETTRPVSGKPKSASLTRVRRNSTPSRKDRSYSVIHKKQVLKAGQQTSHESEPDTCDPEDQNANGQNPDVKESENGDMEEEDKPQIAVRVKKTDPVDKFVEELQHMNEMEKIFKQSTLELQKKLGIDTNGFVY